MISGGPPSLHDHAATTAALVALAGEVGIDSTVPDHPAAALDLLADGPGSDLVTVDALLWQMPAERHAPLRDQWAFVLEDRHADALLAHVEGGGGLLACHTAPITFDADPRWRALLGASWSWDRSHHPPVGPIAVRPVAGASHPVIEGVDAPFELVDEVYADLDLDPDVAPLLSSEIGGVDQPLLWARAVGRGRVVVDLLGHDVRSYQDRTHAEIVRAAMRWLTTEAPR